MSIIRDSCQIVRVGGRIIQNKEWLPQRYVISFLGFLCLALNYVMRFSLGLAIVEMVRPILHHGKPPFTDPNACPTSTNTPLNLTSLGEGEFEWSEKTQGLILSSFFWGYVVTQVPGGLLSDRLGGKTVLGVGVFVSSLGTILTPIAARLGGPYWLIAVRVLIGLGQGVIYPSMHVITSHWIPKEERGRLGTFVFSGSNFGNVISMSLTGVILGLYKGQWPIVFYLYGGFGLFWLVLWYFLAYSSPLDHPYLSEKERKFLSHYSTTVDINKGYHTPWKSILTSKPVWAMCIAMIGHDWGLFTIITDLPKYMKSVMHYTITQNGLLLSLPYLLMWMIAMSSGVLVDWINKRKFVSITVNRKIFTTIASVGPAIGILGATYSGCNRSLATTFFILGMGLMGFFYPSLKVNALDLSPNFAGTISAFVIGIGAVSGMITPYLVGILTPQSTLLEWREVFWISVLVLIGTNLFYLFTASGEVQKWNSPDTPKTDEEEPEKYIQR